MSEWFMTDDDCLQHCRPYPAIDPDCYEFVQISSVPGSKDEKPLYQVSHGTIDMKDYSKEEMEDVLGFYGYKDLDDFAFQNATSDEWIYDENGNLDRENSPSYVIDYQLIAEMFFETENQEYTEPELYDWNGAVQRISDIIGEALGQMMEPKRIKVYDLKELFEKELNLHPFRWEKIAIFEGAHGIIIAEHEAVQMRENRLTDSIEIEATDIPEPGHIFTMPNKMVTASIEELKKASFTEMTMEEFFDRREYNPRCISNYAGLMRNLREISFDLHGYFETHKPLDQQISIAKGKNSRIDETTRTPDHER